ncbi:uncharacterized protein H6S33_003831 [Morchella sextelata]|uniref:uncharacterized protein n=1 Tax=Morchella sextelata TaxID=1174677 RepID=UPI001D053A8A|nr:uncharacterized protein H6S33_003831 [Morchella sextelata]KAH0606170.1 hypothetical protein H6S33_003831 [Morchella sextelata]
MGFVLFKDKQIFQTIKQSTPREKRKYRGPHKPQKIILWERKLNKVFSLFFISYSIKNDEDKELYDPGKLGKAVSPLKVYKASKIIGYETIAGLRHMMIMADILTCHE